MSASHRVRGRFVTGVLLVLILSLNGCGPKVTIAVDELIDPTVWYVATTGTDTAGSCHTVATACRTIQFVVDQAVNGDTVHIADGVYAGRVEIGGEDHIDDLYLTVIGSGPGTILENPIPGANVGDMGSMPYWGGVLNVQCNQCDGNVQISNLTIRNGIAANGGGIAVHYVSLDMQNVTIENSTAGNGGCLFIYGETTVTMDQVTLRGCNAADDGGGIHNNYASFLTMTDSQFIENVAGLNGGGLFNAYGSNATISETLFENNTAGNFGGALYNYGELWFNGGTIRGNEASAGGGLFSAGGWAGLSFMTIHANRASHGAGIDNQGSLDLSAVTISGNQGYGSGIETAGSDAVLLASSVTIAENPNGGIVQRIGGAVTLYNTLLAGNGSANCNMETVIGGANNLSSDSTCDFAGSANQTGVDALLGPLADNGGPTLTHALLPGSPALDTGTMNFSPSFDQRGVSRPQDANGDGLSRFDIGAYEFVPDVPDLRQFVPPPVEPVGLFVPDQPTNCRQGPAPVYPNLTSILAGVAYPVDGKNDAGDWYRLWVTENIQCWVRGDLGRLFGDPLQIVLRDAPPPPEPTEVPTAVVVCSHYASQSACEAYPQCLWYTPLNTAPFCKDR